MEVKCEKPLTENEKENASKLYKYLLKNDVATKEEMLDFLGWNKSKDRQLRNLLSIIGQRKPLISVSSGKGYKIAKDESDLREVEHTWAELSSRIEEIQKRIEPLIKFYDKYKYKMENEQ